MSTDSAAAGGAGPGESRFASRTVIALLAATAATVLALAVRSAWHPYPFEPGDGGTLSSAWHIVSRGPIYNEIGDMPYVFNIHNPVFIHLSALMMYLFGPRPEGPRLLAERRSSSTPVSSATLRKMRSLPAGSTPISKTRESAAGSQLRI